MKEFFHKICRVFTIVANAFANLCCKICGGIFGCYYKTPKKAFAITIFQLFIFTALYFIFENTKCFGGKSLSDAIDCALMYDDCCAVFWRVVYYSFIFIILALYIGTSIWLLYTRDEPIWSIMVMFNSVVFVAIEMIVTSAILYGKEFDMTRLFENLFTAYSTCMIACSTIITVVAGVKFNNERARELSKKEHSELPSGCPCCLHKPDDDKE